MHYSACSASLAKPIKASGTTGPTASGVKTEIRSVEGLYRIFTDYSSGISRRAKHGLLLGSSGIG
jgi:hypothetical protein